jgi:hypothetical protein
MPKRKDHSLYAKKRNERYLLRRALLSKSFHDYSAAEIVYTSEHEKIVLAQMQQDLEFSKSDLAQFGDVLIHRGVESPDLAKIK